MRNYLITHVTEEQNGLLATMAHQPTIHYKLETSRAYEKRIAIQNVQAMNRVARRTRRSRKR